MLQRRYKKLDIKTIKGKLKLNEVRDSNNVMNYFLVALASRHPPRFHVMSEIMVKLRFG